MINNYLERQIKENFPYQPTPEQEIAVKSLSEFLLSPRSEVVFMLRGYAGTGKTSLVGALVRTLDKLQQKGLLVLIILSCATGTRIDRILERQPIPEPEHPQVPERYDIEFRHVSFFYENTEQGTRTKVLHDINFKAQQGEITALVGPSGSGKSTVANLIPRFWDVEQGEILIGGVNIKQIATAELMDTVSFVFQDTFLFYDTLYENIAIGSPSAGKEAVIAAAEAAQCHDFIERLPDGYDTKIGDKGIFLSGGEAQRICVARAILKNAPILVLDEATAFADPENEYKMQMALQSLIKDKTVIVIAHRLSSIVSAHQIVVMKEGRIVQCGKHNILSVKEGVYKSMWDAYRNAYHWSLNKN